MASAKVGQSVVQAVVNADPTAKVFQSVVQLIVVPAVLGRNAGIPVTAIYKMSDVFDDQRREDPRGAAYPRRRYAYQ